MITLMSRGAVKDFKTCNVTYSPDGCNRYTEIKTYSGVKLLIINSTSKTKDDLFETTNVENTPFLTIEITSKHIPNKLNNWVKKHGLKSTITCETQDEVEVKYTQFIYWIKTLRSNKDREEKLIQNLKEQIEQNFTIATTVLLYIYNRQTQEEKRKKKTINRNWKGFTSRDAQFMSNAIDIVKRNDKQKLQTIEKDICHRTKKYAAQYLGVRGVIEDKMDEAVDDNE